MQKVRGAVTESIGQGGSYVKSPLPQSDGEDMFQEMQ